MLERNSEYTTFRSDVAVCYAYSYIYSVYTDAELFNASHPYCIAVEHIGRILDGV